MQKSKDHRNYTLELKLKMFNGILKDKNEHNCGCLTLEAKKQQPSLEQIKA